MTVLAGLYRAFRGYAQLGQQIICEGWRIALQGDGAGHAAQPAFGQRLVDWPLRMEGRNADAAVFLGEQTWPAQPAAEKARQLVARGAQVGGVQ